MYSTQCISSLFPNTTMYYSSSIYSFLLLRTKKPKFKAQSCVFTHGCQLAANTAFIIAWFWRIFIRHAMLIEHLLTAWIIAINSKWKKQTPPGTKQYSDPPSSRTQPIYNINSTNGIIIILAYSVYVTHAVSDCTVTLTRLVYRPTYSILYLRA
jgi:hypothetical protein